MICSHAGRKCCNRPANGRAGKLNKYANISEGRWVGREGLTADVGLAETDPGGFSCVLCLGPRMTELKIGGLVLGGRILERYCPLPPRNRPWILRGAEPGKNCLPAFLG